MKNIQVLGVLAAVALLLSGVARAEDAGGEAGLLKRAASVDNPIPDTYEPLSSTYVGDGEKLNQTIEQSWQLKKQAREREQAAASPPPSPERQALEQRIQEPGSQPATESEPQVRDTGSGLYIRGD